MSVNWKKGYDTERLAQKLEAAKSTDSSGKVTFNAFEFEDCAAVLFNIIECNGDVPESDKHKMVHGALFSAGHKGIITASTILSEFRKLESAFLKQPPSQYVLCTSLSVTRFSKPKSINADGGSIKFLRNLPPEFAEPANKLLHTGQRSLPAKPPNNYLTVQISVNARSPEAAANQAFEVLDLIRGIWNFRLNIHRPMRYSSGIRNPVNLLVSGPLQTLHLPTGELATDMWWYDPDYQHPLKPYDINKSLKMLFRFGNSARKILSSHCNKNIIETGIREYCRALDHTNWNTAFLKLWSVLESLTHTEMDNYKVTIRRAAFVWREPDYHKEILNHLRELRNSFVHANKSSNSIELYMYQLKRYVEAMIRFHLGRGRIFSNIEEAADFLDLPTNLDILKKKNKMLNMARRFRHT